MFTAIPLVNILLIKCKLLLTFEFKRLQLAMSSKLEALKLLQGICCYCRASKPL